ncbi:MAG: hypothetical protein F6K04_17425 [Leptolyngbya sp. SIO4C5]|nr:hypothetical protein [Leptolyngbya sp. SIO4C5]
MDANADFFGVLFLGRDRPRAFLLCFGLNFAVQNIATVGELGKDDTADLIRLG